MYFIHAVPQLRPNIFCELDQFSITNSPSEETRVLNVERRPLSLLSEFWKIGPIYIYIHFWEWAQNYSRLKFRNYPRALLNCHLRVIQSRKTSPFTPTKVFRDRHVQMSIELANSVHCNLQT